MEDLEVLKKAKLTARLRDRLLKTIEEQLQRIGEVEARQCELVEANGKFQAMYRLMEDVCDAQKKLIKSLENERELLSILTPEQKGELGI